MIKIAFLVLFLLCESVFAQDNQNVKNASNMAADMCIRLSGLNTEILQFSVTVSERGLYVISNVTKDYVSEFCCAMKTIPLCGFIPPENKEPAFQMLCSNFQIEAGKLKNNRATFNAGYAQLTLQSSRQKADKARKLIDEADHLRIRLKDFFCTGQLH
jgi:hypothetical protein